MICDVYKLEGTPDTLFLCDGDNVLNGSQQIERISGHAARIPTHPMAKLTWVGSIDHHGDYVETLHRFRKKRDALGRLFGQGYPMVMEIPDEWVRKVHHEPGPPLKLYDIRSKYPAEMVNAMYGKQEKNMNESFLKTSVGIEGAIVVCDEQNVQGMCHQGYRLLDIIYDERPEHVQETLVDLPSDGHNPYNNKSRSFMKTVVVRRARYVMVKDEESVIAELTGKINDLSSKHFHADAKEKEALKQKDAAEARVKELEGVRDRHLETIRGKQTELGQLRDAGRKFEEDIAKIRSAIGEIKMKEILG